MSSDDRTAPGISYVQPGHGMLMPKHRCGRCSVSESGGRRHRVYGWLCQACADAIKAKQEAKK
jgi:hypothetical protein